MKSPFHFLKWFIPSLLVLACCTTICILNWFKERPPLASSAHQIPTPPSALAQVAAASQALVLPVDPPPASVAVVTTPVTFTPIAVATNAAEAATVARLTFGSQWDAPHPGTPALAAFAGWTVRYLAAAPADQTGLLPAGVALAQARRTAFARLIRDEPAEALATTVPLAVRSQLPAPVTALLEDRVSGRGDLQLLATTAAPGQPTPAESTFRTAIVKGHSYRAHVYGRRQHQTTKVDISLAGVALDGQMAVSESPVRMLEKGELSSTTRTVSPSCPIAGIQSAVPSAQNGAPLQDSSAALGGTCGPAIEVGGTVEVPCCVTHVAATESSLIKAEDTLGPYAGALSAQAFAAAADTSATAPAVTGALYPTSWTEGPKTVMVILAEFSDLPGPPLDVSNNNAPITPASILTDFYAGSDGATFNNGQPCLNSFLASCSYGTTSVVLTSNDFVSVQMPATATSYAVNYDYNGLQRDAQAAALAAGHDPDAYDRIMLVFPSMSAIPGSQITYAGQAEVGGKEIWINANFGSLDHEFGHTYGLQHANLYKTTDGTVTGAGSSIEYGDPTDKMGGSYTGEYNMWSRNLLGWMPDTAVTNVTTSGTYRVYRFDSQNANLAQSVALKIPGTIIGDSVHDYWIGLRENIPVYGSHELYQAAYILWGYHYSRQSDLLNMDPGEGDGSNAALQVGKTFSENGITITPLAIGGSDPYQFMDVQITVPGTSNTISTFFSGETSLTNGVYYLAFPNGSYFGYYSYLTDPNYIYHFDLGYEYVFDAADGLSGVYFYDFSSNDFFYTSPTFPFPYLYDFGLQSTVYYYPSPGNPGHYTSNPRYFFDFDTGEIIAK